MDSILNTIEQHLQGQGEKPYRIKQVRDAWYTKQSWNDVTTLSKDLRTVLTEQFPWLSFANTKVYTSPKDNTQKALHKLNDGLMVESVYMPNARNARTVCISSQVGCAMACTFCATGTMGMKRNLTVDEIVDQLRFWNIEGTEPISNVVFMGMGEPLANYDAVKQAAQIFIEDMQLGPTRVTVSTVGVPMSLKKLLEDDNFPHTRIAFSLHAGTDATRSSIVPSHKRTSMDTIQDWFEQYLAKRGNRSHYLTIEYVMLLDINDMPSEAHALVERFKHLSGRIKLNLIPWNHTDADMQTSSEHNLKAFQDITERGGITTTIRYSKGLDIAAACGQLVVQKSK